MFKDVVRKIELLVGQKGRMIKDNAYVFANLTLSYKGNKYIANISNPRTLQGIEVTSEDEDDFIEKTLLKYYSAAESPYYAINGLSFVLSKAFAKNMTIFFAVKGDDGLFYTADVTQDKILFKTMESLPMIDNIPVPVEHTGSEDHITIIPPMERENNINCS